MTNRRFFLKLGLLAAAVAALPTRVFAAWNKQAFEKDAVAASLNSLYGTSSHSVGNVAMKVPEIAENGAAVPVEVSSDLSNVESIAILAEKNPRPLAAYFTLGANAIPNVSTRIKLGQSSNVVAVAKTSDGAVHSLTKEVKVTIGGCGG